jgi:hypothetical protein
MLAAGNIAFDNPTDAATAYPALWGNREAAKKALARAADLPRLGTNPNIYLPIRECPQPPGQTSTLRRVEYQRSGAGCRAAVAWFDLALVTDPAEAIGAALGPLAWCCVASDPPPLSTEAEAALPRAPPPEGCTAAPPKPRILFFKRPASPPGRIWLQVPPPSAPPRATEGPTAAAA